MLFVSISKDLTSVLLNLVMSEMQKGAGVNIKNVICINMSIVRTSHAHHARHDVHTRPALGCVMYYATKIWANFSTVTSSRVLSLCLYLNKKHQDYRF